MSRYITVFDDNEPVVYLKGEPWANLAQIKQSLPLQEIYDIETYVQDGQTYVRYIVKA